MLWDLPVIIIYQHQVGNCIILNVVNPVLLIAFRALDKCDPGLFNKLVGIYPELAAHERAVDVLIDLFKKDEVQYSTLPNLYIRVRKIL